MYKYAKAINIMNHTDSEEPQPQKKRGNILFDDI